MHCKTDRYPAVKHCEIVHSKRTKATEPAESRTHTVIQRSTGSLASISTLLHLLGLLLLCCLERPAFFFGLRCRAAGARTSGGTLLCSWWCCHSRVLPRVGVASRHGSPQPSFVALTRRGRRCCRRRCLGRRRDARRRFACPINNHRQPVRRHHVFKVGVADACALGDERQDRQHELVVPHQATTLQQSGEKGEVWNRQGCRRNAAHQVLDQVLA